MGGNMLKKSGRALLLLFTEADVRAIQESLAGLHLFSMRAEVP
jgi:hypothetical protein